MQSGLHVKGAITEGTGTAEEVGSRFAPLSQEVCSHRHASSRKEAKVKGE